MTDQHESTDAMFDVAVIGAGLIGCAIARRFTLLGAHVVVLEKGRDILDGASKANSAILHTGFDAPENSLELECIKNGHAEYLEIRDRLGLPLDQCGALVLAWSEEEEAKLEALIAQAHANGITDIEPLGRGAILELEPNLSHSVRAGFRVPRESLIDPWSAPHAYLLQALENGAELRRNCTVTGGAFENGAWRIETSTGAVNARLVINAAGLFGDRIDTALFGTSDFEIRPRKGQFVVYDKMAARLARNILLPVPGEKTKGIVVCRTVWGNLLVGPTAEEQDDRVNATLDQDILAMLKQKGADILPGLADEEVTTVYAGLRPASERKEYRIKRHEGLNAITVGGIRSTGLSSALGIAQHVAALAEDLGGTHDPLSEPVWPRVPNISELAPRDWQQAGNGGIVCHCEMVTRREIAAAMSGPLAPNALAGLKRRTRVTMGRCQGFYCSAGLAACTKGALETPMVSETR